MVLSPTFVKNAKNDRNTFLNIKFDKKKIGKPCQSAEMTWKVAVFDMFRVITRSILKMSTWNFLHIRNTFTYSSDIAI